jgi:hypothetical protein
VSYAAGKKEVNQLIGTVYYHCVSRCVRRSYLCGVDEYSGQNYEHRRGWLEDRLLYLLSVFAIDTCAFAVMSNHVHLVLHVDTENAQGRSDKQVLALWPKPQKPQTTPAFNIVFMQLNKHNSPKTYCPL